ncbi:MAG: IS1595 family transposase [candidate division Zixibacteria bacterium]|nr:IS1595 family transposase [candidate division Zixibacteria bacterium]
MDIKSFHLIVRKENIARRFLAKRLWKNYRRFCIRCKSYKVYRLSDGRFRCKRCGYTYFEWTGRWLGKLKISAIDWFWIIKLFELELSTRKIAKQVSISYPTVLKAVDLIRRSIVTESKGDRDLIEGEVEMDEAYFGGKRKGKRGRGAGHKIPVFGILERQGIVPVEVLPNVSAQSLLNLTVKKVRRGNIVYTDKFRGYDALMFCGYRHLRIDHEKVFSSGKVYINGLEGFWSYAKERLIKHHGVSIQKFPLYLKEMEFRYNHRNQNIFEILTQNLCNFVSDPL